MGDEKPIGGLSVEREESSVVLVVDEDDGEDEERYYLPPSGALRVSMWLDDAVEEAVEYATQNEGDQP